MDKIVHITRRERFSAAHKLWNDDFSPEKNKEVFGKCSNPNWHGHNYELFVTVKGPVQPDTGFVVDLSELGKVVRERVIAKLDHKNVNLETDFMKGVLASTENIAIGIWEELVDPVKEIGGTLHRVRIVETENNYVDYYG